MKFLFARDAVGDMALVVGLEERFVLLLHIAGSKKAAQGEPERSTGPLRQGAAFGSDSFTAAARYVRPAAPAWGFRPAN